MAIDIRDSRISLDVSTILERVDPVDIYSYYLGSNLKVNQSYPSPFRLKDENPSFRLQIGHRGDLRFSDYGLNWFGDCFDFVQKLYGIDFKECLRQIDRDLNLGLASGINIPPVRKTAAVRYAKQKSTEIRIRSRVWSNKDREYWWGRYRISEAMLDFYDVKPLTHIWINGNRMAMGSSISYSFKIGRHYKIYRPFGKKTKWMSNTKKHEIQGYEQLPHFGPLLIITSSLKDVMTLNVLGFNAIAFQSEMMIPDSSTMNELKQRFEEVVLLYDNDHTKTENPGQTMALKLCEKFNLYNLVIPEEYEDSKDVSDLVHKYGIIQGYKLLKTLIDYELCIT